jgi:hypothetical protein
MVPRAREPRYNRTMKEPIEAAYPDVSEIFRRKAEARKERAALPYGEKIAIVEAHASAWPRSNAPARSAKRRAASPRN